MGTRNLTCVMADGQYKIAQYGQWDGYPEGQGTTVLKFCSEHLSTVEGQKQFKQKLELVQFMPAPKGYAANSRPSSLSRDLGAEILNTVLNATNTVVAFNEIEFASNSLHCEWAYVIDLDKKTVEVYIGFNTNPLDDTERFAKFPTHHFSTNQFSADSDSKIYYPIRHLRSWKLNDLPSNHMFVETLRNDYGVNESDE